MEINFKIPKFTDREIVAALGRVRKRLEPKYRFQIAFTPPRAERVKTESDSPEQMEELKYILNEASMIISSFELMAPRANQLALQVTRDSKSVTDNVKVTDQWIDHESSPTDKRHMTVAAELLSASRAEFGALDVEASLSGKGDAAWDRFRELQMAVLSSLQQSLQKLVVDASQKNLEIDRTRTEEFAKREAELRTNLEKEKTAEWDKLRATTSRLEQREKELAELQKSFNTKEARYVARSKQEEQIKQIQKWLEGWNLTTGTQAKRTPVMWAYIAALVATGGLTAFATVKNYQIINSATAVSSFAWWEWAVLSLKSIAPFAAFISFMVYFIRWSTSWAREHSEEEFRNRGLLIDIGRASWLLEAVRDAHELQKEIPETLLKELSRNLFATLPSTDTERGPQPLNDLVSQSISSFRLKSPDGSEMELTGANGNKKR